jgi:hypothetical protein
MSATDWQPSGKTAATPPESRSNETRATLRLRSPADLLAAVPYLLGFHPSDSIVVLALRGSRTVFHARADAPPAGADAAGVDELAQHVATIVLRQRPTGALVVGYGAADRIDPVLGRTRQALERAGVHIVEVVRADKGRFWSHLCTDAVCCPAEGTPFDVSSSTVAATATYAGCVALPDRAALEMSVAPLHEPAMEAAVSRCVRDLETLGRGGSRRWRSLARRALGEAFERYAIGGRLADEELGRLAVLVKHVAARDEAWQKMLAGPPRDEHVALWRDGVRRLPDRYVAAPATLLALAAWRTGDGALAWVAVDRALTAEPSYSMAQLVAQALQAGVPPSIFDGLADGKGDQTWGDGAHGAVMR